MSHTTDHTSLQQHNLMIALPASQYSFFVFPYTNIHANDSLVTAAAAVGRSSTLTSFLPVRSTGPLD